MTFKVYKLTVMVIDYDHVGEDEARLLLEHGRFANHAIIPTVMACETAEIDWAETPPHHPLNFKPTMAAAFADLFPDDGGSDDD